MRAIVLAGGHATRLWPITRHRPKPLLPLGESSILDRLLDQVVPLANDVIVSTNARFEAEFAEALEGWDARMVVEDQAREAEKPGALGALFQIVDDLSDDEELLVVGGDNYYGFEMADFVEATRDRRAPTVAVKQLERREDARSFGVVELAEGTRIRTFHEKPDDPPSNLAATALYHYPPGWRELFDDYEAAARKAEDTRERFDAPGRILEWGVERDRPVHAWSFEAPWHDIGTPEGYMDALRGVVGDRFVEGTLEDCKAGEGVYVFGDAVARGSTLERTILMPSAHVEDAELTGCIVDSEAHVADVALEDSLVGPHDRLSAPSGS